MKKKTKIFRVTTSPEALAVLLKGQLKFLNNFFEIVAISNPGQQLNQVKLDEKVRVIPLQMVRRTSPIKDLISLIKMILIIKNEKPDIVHSHTPKAGFISMIAAKLCGVPHRLHTVAGLPLIEKKGIEKKILLLVEWLTYKCATKIHPNSKGLKKYILKTINTDKNKVEVIGDGSSNGIDVDYFKKSLSLKNDANFFTRTNKLNNVFKFIFVGRIVKDKGIEELINAFVRLNKEISNIRLLIVGREERSLDPISDNTRSILKNNKNIIELGYRKDIRKYLAASNCLVLPSYREGFPNVVLQADCMNLPSIVSNINGCNEIITDRQNGLLVTPKKTELLYLAMKKIVIDKKLYRSLKSSTRKNTVKKFNQKNFFKKIFFNYQNLSKQIILLKKKFLILGSLGSSLINFRGELIKLLIKNGYQVYCGAPNFSLKIKKQIKNYGAKCINVEIDNQSINPIKFIFDFYKFKKTINKIKPNYLLGYTSKPIFYLGLASFFTKNTKFIPMITGLGYYFNRFNKKFIVKLILIYLYKLSCIKAKIFIFQNKSDQKEFADLKIINKNSKSIVVNGSGVNLSNSCKKNYSNKIKFIMVSRLLYQKGLIEYVEAARIIKNKFPKVEFVHVGGFDDSPDRINKEIYDNWKKEKNIDFLGEVKIEKVYGLLKKSNIFVLPSYYREGIPRSSIEALAMGCAILTTDQPGCRSTVINGSNGFLFSVKNTNDLAKKMMHIIENPKLLKQFQTNSYKLSKKFDVKNINSVIINNINNLDM